MTHFMVRIFGRVQGVFFRASAKEQADQLGLKGLVRNEPDGSVYVEVEGESETLKLFLMWCSRGPEMAHVTSHEIQEGALKNYTSFEIER